MPTRRAGAVWEGGLKEGKGTFDSQSGALGGSYTFGTRFAEAKGTNPEELLAAAEAACFSMALSASLEKAGTPSTRIETQAVASLEKVGEGFQITTMKLTVRGTVPNIDAATFQAAAVDTKDNCIVSKALKGVQIDVEATLV